MQNIFGIVIGIGIATIDLVATGLWMGVILRALIVGVIIILSCGNAHILRPLIVHMPMPGVKCPTCASRGIEQWVLPGKHCPNCATACRNVVDIIITSIYLLLNGYISIATICVICSTILS